MQVILLERIEKLGMLGQVVDVKPGFARNYLLPQKKALRATPANMEIFDKQKAEIEAKNLKAKQDAEFVAKKVEGIHMIMVRQAGETGQLYGSVSAKDVVDGVMTVSSVSINRAQVIIGAPIKLLGIHGIHVMLHPEVKVQVNAVVAQTSEEAKIMIEKAKGSKAKADPQPDAVSDLEEVVEA
jgi:large subunit ribosomal protein L9